MGVLVTLLLCWYTFRNFRRGTILTAVSVQLLSYLGTGIPGLKIFAVVSIFSFICYFRNKKKISCDKYPKPIIFASSLFVISYLLTTFIVANGRHADTVFANIFTFFVFPYLLWKSIDSESMIHYAIQKLRVIMIIACVFAVLEVITKVNVPNILLNAVFPFEDYALDSEGIRFGMKRISSIFAYGGPCGVFFYMSWVVFYAYKYFYNCDNSKSLQFLILLLPACSIATGSRAVMIGLSICLLFILVDKANFRRNGFISFMVLVIITVPLWIDFVMSIIYSITNSNASDAVGGSSTDMRETQWEICLPYWMDSYWLGNGRMYIWDFVRPDHPLLLGAESVWFSLVVDWGLMGCVSYVTLILCSSIVLWKVNPRYICIPLAYLATTSFSVDNGYQYNCLLTFVILLIKVDTYSNPKSLRYNE